MAEEANDVHTDFEGYRKKDLFKDVCAYIDASVPGLSRKRLTAAITKLGGTIPDEGDPFKPGRARFNLSQLTHYITETISFPEYDLILELQRKNARNAQKRMDTDADESGAGSANTPCIVSPRWLTRSFDLEKVQDPRFFSSEPSLIFSGICVCCTNLSLGDSESIKGAVSALGGQWRNELTREVTHVIAGSPGGKNYEKALSIGKDMGMHVLLPQWIDDCFSFHCIFPVEPYCYPNPTYNHPQSWDRSIKPTTLAKKTNGSDQSMTSYDGSRPPMKEKINQASLATYQTELEGVNSPHWVGPNNERPRELPTKLSSAPAPQKAQESDLFSGRRVYLSSDLSVRTAHLKAIQRRIQDAGGLCWSWTLNGLKDRKIGDLSAKEKRELRRMAEKEIGKAETVICWRRSGFEYWKAYDLRKTIGNLSWIYFVLASSIWEAPQDRILHYPYPPKPVEGFQKHFITVTNYTATNRDCVRRLVEAMGAAYSGPMTKLTTHVVAASKTGRKITHAEEWNVPIVNHSWLEECFLSWSDVPIGSNHQFTTFPPGVNLATVLNNTALPQRSIEKWAAREDVRAERMAALSPIEPEDDEEEEECMEAEAEEADAEEEDTNMEDAVAQGAEGEGDVEEEEPAPEPEPEPEKAPSPPKKRRKSSTKSASAEPTTSTPAKRGRPPNTPQANLSGPETEAPPSDRSRRSAASAARNKVAANAEDMNQWAKERKSKKRHREDEFPETGPSAPAKKVAFEEDSSSSPEEEENMKGKGKGKAKAAPAPKKKGKSRTEELRESSGPPKGGRMTKNIKSPEDYSSFDAPPGAKHSAVRVSRISAEGKQVKYIATGVVIDKDKIKTLNSIKIKQTTKPEECTHLIAHAISRTEKFLCSLSHSPFIVTEQWINESIRQGSAIEETPFLLNDTDGEKKYKVNLQQSLERAKKNPKYLEGKSFWVTPNVETAKDILVRVIRSAGGTVRNDKPNARLLDDPENNTILISGPKDRSTWSPLKAKNKNIRVYTPELVLLGTLNQELDLNSHQLS